LLVFHAYINETHGSRSKEIIKDNVSPHGESNLQSLVVSVSNTAFFRQCFICLCIYLFILWYLVLNFLWTEVKDCDSWNHKQHCAGFKLVYDAMMTGRISKQLCTNVMLYGSLKENLRTRRNFWSVPDQIVTSRSGVMTADFFLPYLGTLCVTFIIHYTVGHATRQHPGPWQVLTSVRPSAFSSNYQ
jgi:hypothetical protein